MNRLPFLLVIALLSQVSAAAAFTYTTNWYDAAGTPVTGVRAMNFQCVDSVCENPLGALLTDSSSVSNSLAVSYPVPAPQFGYGTFFYAQCFLDQELMFTPTQNGNYTTNARFDKAQNCVAPIPTLIASANATVNQTVNLTAVIQSALVELDHFPRGEPQDALIQEQFYSAETLLTLIVADADGHILSTQSRTLNIPRSSTLPASFTWQPTVPGTYDIALRTTVPDCKCNSTLERIRTLQIVVANATNDTNTTNHPPVVTITTPPNGTNATNGTSLNFTGTGSDAEDGTLLGSQLVWDSSIDGFLGTGSSIRTTLRTGVHQIILTGTDSDGASASDRITLTVTRTPTGTPASAVFETNTSTNATNATEPFTVSFSCTGDGDAPRSFEIAFGDGAVAITAPGANVTELRSTYTYVQQGMYTATCKVIDADGDSAIVSQSLTVYDSAPLAAFTTAPNPQYENLPIVFTDASAGYDQPLTYSWDFGDGTISTLHNPVPIYVAQGTYAAVLTVTDADGSTSLAREDISILNITNQTNTTNLPPLVQILLPSDPSVTQGTRIAFVGSGIDPEEGVLSGSQLIWTSDINGVFGIGQTFASSALLVGTHTISLTGQDLQGLTASDSITLTILANDTNQTDSTPVVTFTANTANSTNLTNATNGIEPLAVFFDCSATGDLPMFTFIDFGDGEATSLQQVVHIYHQQGFYRATCTAIDADGDRATQNLLIVVGDSAPIAEFIFTPGIPVEGQSVQFTDASIAYDQPLTPLWDFGDGGTSRMRNPAHAYVAGSYLVTLQVTDADGSSATISHVLTIEPLPQVNNTPPNATITRPADRSTFPPRAITFEGFGLDREDGLLSGSQLSWDSSIDGFLGTGSILPRASLSEGLHLITLTATDGLYATGSTSILLLINASAPNNGTNTTNTSNTPPNATILRPVDGAIFIFGTPVIFEGIGRDREDGVLSGSQLAWRSDRDGALGTGDLLGTTLLSFGIHQITLTATDSLTATGSTSITLTLINRTNATNETNDTLAPTVELQLPSNSSMLTDDEVTFTYYLTDDRDAVLDCTLYTDRLGLFAAEQTQLSSSGASDTFVVLNFPDGNYRWNVECRDDASNAAFAPVDFFFTIDAVPAPAVCADGLDNDGDGLTDFGITATNDPGCASSTDSSELNAAIACDDGQDNDLDTFTDFPDDLGCASAIDTDEQDSPVPACSDGIDNDGDGFTDYPADLGCSALTDDSEAPHNGPPLHLDDFTISMFASPVNGEAPLAVQFGVNVVGGNAPHTFAWQFDDGRSAIIAQPAHTYRAAGRYRARVTVTDADGVPRTQLQLITVDQEQSAESLYIRSIRINDAIDPVVRSGDDLEINLDLELRDGDIPDRLSIRATLFGPAGVEAVGANSLLRPFRRHGRISPVLFVQVPPTAAPGTYDLRISITDEHGRTRSKHRDVVVR